MSSTEFHFPDLRRRPSSTPARPDGAATGLGDLDVRECQACARDQAREDERQRMARRLHDDLGQRLAVLQLDIGVLRGRAAIVADPVLSEGIARVSQQLSQAVAVVRDLADEWRPVALDDLGLNDALDALARRSAQRMGIEVTLRCDEQDPPVPPCLVSALYRCAQEALRNVAQHARATDVALALFCDGAQVCLQVQDNGVGPPAGRLPDGGTLEGLAERIRAFGGELTLDRTLGSGACLRVCVPVDGRRPHADQRLSP
jgi:signal transduction histidine kinase